MLWPKSCAEKPGAMDEGLMPLPDAVEAAYAAGKRMAERSTTEMAGAKVYFHPLKFKVSDSC